MATTQNLTYPRRVYPLSLRDMTEEQLAVVFAMTSRRPEAFDEIAQLVSQEKAADFHERWVLGYGHASVAEHAVLHMAVENISRLACDTLEDNRLASYTEKSSRFQVLPDGYYQVPTELEDSEELRTVYISTCDYLFKSYRFMIDSALTHLKTVRLQQDERESAYNMRLRREAIDSCRFLLPAATLTNVGVTINARMLEHAITKLLSSELVEEWELGEVLKAKGREITPTLIKYADRNDYLTSSRQRQDENATSLSSGELIAEMADVDVSLVNYATDAEELLTAALLYRASHVPYDQVWQQVRALGSEERRGLIASCLDNLGPHDAPLRELELVDYTFEFLMDYGAYREFKRHRMQSSISQSLTVGNGYVIPPLFLQAGLREDFERAMGKSEEGYRRIAEVSPKAAQYLVTHAHKRRVLTKVNLRECYHLFKLRTQPQAHFSIRGPMENAMKLAVEVHPYLFRYLRLREYPAWWPFATQTDS